MLLQKTTSPQFISQALSSTHFISQALSSTHADNFFFYFLIFFLLFFNIIFQFVFFFYFILFYFFEPVHFFLKEGPFNFYYLFLKKFYYLFITYIFNFNIVQLSQPRKYFYSRCH